MPILEALGYANHATIQRFLKLYSDGNIVELNKENDLV